MYFTHSFATNRIIPKAISIFKIYTKKYQGGGNGNWAGLVAVLTIPGSCILGQLL